MNTENSINLMVLDRFIAAFGVEAGTEKYQDYFFYINTVNPEMLEYFCRIRQSTNFSTELSSLVEAIDMYTATKVEPTI